MLLNSTCVRLKNEAELCPGEEGRLKVGSIFSGEGNVFFRACYLPKSHLKSQFTMGSMKSLLDLEEAMGGGGICTPSKNKFYPFLRIWVTTTERGGGRR